MLLESLNIPLSSTLLTSDRKCFIFLSENTVVHNVGLTLKDTNTNYTFPNGNHIIGYTFHFLYQLNILFKGRKFENHK